MNLYRFNQSIPCSFLIVEEYITISVAALLNIFILIFTEAGRAVDIFALNLIIIAAILGVAFVHKRFAHAWMQFFRDWYPPAFLIVIYLENRRLIPLVNPHDLDGLLIKIDRFLFLGQDPTILMESITWPILSEILQAAYASFYFLPFALGVVVYRTRPRIDFHINVATLLTGFYLTFIGYYLTPAIGPRFTLDHLQTFPLEGVFWFDCIRTALDRAEGLMRDCCPSGHTMISMLTVLLARRYARAFFPAACIWAILIIISSVYLRYHYVIDLIAGVFLSIWVYWFCPAMVEALIFRPGAKKLFPQRRKGAEDNALKGCFPLRLSASAREIEKNNAPRKQVSLFFGNP